MRLLWLALGGSVVAGVLLLTKKSKADSMTPTFDPTQFYGERQKVALALPAGWRRVTNSEVASVPELVTSAKALRNTPGFTTMNYGTISPFTASDGNTYATWVEQHYHEPGGATKPWGLHHGVTLLAQA